MIYLIHFEHRLHHAGHYLGYTIDLQARLKAHRDGQGARLMAVIKELNIPWCLARVWEDGDRALERRLKQRKSGPRLCPICNPSLLTKKREKKRTVSD